MYDRHYSVSDRELYDARDLILLAYLQMFSHLRPEPLPPEDGSHKHMCPKCQTVWEHSNKCRGSQEAHTCPLCGTSQREWYEGEKLATHIGDACNLAVQRQTTL